MDENAVVDTVERSEPEPNSLNLLKRIPLVKEYGPRIEWLWDRIKTQDYAFDDLNRGNSQCWINSLGMLNSEHFEFGDDGYVMTDSIIPSVNANIHFVIWGKRDIREILQAGRELITYLFSKYHLNRITALTPVNNKNAIRMAVLLRFRYEGELRKIFLFHGNYYNISIYGLLRSELTAKEVIQ